MDGDSNEVVFADKHGRVLLRPAGEVGLGWPMRVEAAAGLFDVIVKGDARNFPAFCEALKNLHSTLSGSARLTLWN